MKIRKIKTCAVSLAILAVVWACFSPVFGRGVFNPEDLNRGLRKPVSDVPGVMGVVHNIGKIGLSVTNQGNFGTGFIGSFIDPMTGLSSPSCQFPYPGGLEYLFAGAFWIGAVVGRDTLVSVGADGWQLTREMWPEPTPSTSTGNLDSPIGGFEYHSITDPSDDKAISEQDWICRYYDTVTNQNYVDNDPVDNRPHIPLNIEVYQRSYAWSYSYAEDFVLFDYSIKNIGRRTLNQVYMGIYVDADVQKTGSTDGYTDDICGFKWSIPSPLGCNFVDTIRIAWIADNDGKDKKTDPCPFTENGSLTAVTGTRVVRTPSDSLKYSFNWWISNGSPALDFGPRRVGTADDPFRDFGGFLGTPEGDRNKYYIMRHEEFDYDQLFSAVDHTAQGWLQKSGQSADFADGYDTRYLISFGPFDIDPGEVLPISFAYVAGDDFHTKCGSFEKLFNAAFPDEYYNQLGFEDLGLNAIWASWIYDNPGVDTDGDTYKGKYRICVYDSIWVEDTTTGPNGWVPTLADTIYYEGDGVPDFVGAQPPPPPIVRLYPRITETNEGEIKVRFNGYRSEMTPDAFSSMLDFEGYRVYISLTNSQKDYVLVTSYDKDDYNKYIWNNSRETYELKDAPFTLEQLQAAYGSNFNPLAYPRDNPFYYKDSAFYFTMQDWNQSSLDDTMLIHKAYPDQPFPTTLIVDSAKIHYPDELVDDSLFKYFEYEYTIRHVLPSQLYYVSVTAFDYGSPQGGLPSLESRQTANSVADYAQDINSVVEAKGLPIIVYPNPYRSDGNYASQEGGGFEGRDSQDLPADRERRIHFMNLPNKCTIRIFTIDGDLVREIVHDYPEDAPQSQHDYWDLITRNTQAAVSGIYYWSVESAKGNQVGKLVIIM
jgi:hypothetical protein